MQSISKPPGARAGGRPPAPARRPPTASPARGDADGAEGAVAPVAGAVAAGSVTLGATMLSPITNRPLWEEGRAGPAKLWPSVARPSVASAFLWEPEGVRHRHAS